MDADITKALIAGTFAVIGAAVAAAITNLEKVRNFFRSSKDSEYLLGAWDCTWDILVPAPGTQVKDIVEITSVNGNVVKGKGSTPGVGNWDLDGKAANLAASFSYSVLLQQPLSGAIVLKKEAPNRMTGAWAQYTTHGDVESGTTTWNRRNP